MYLDVNQKLGQLPQEYQAELLPAIRAQFQSANKTIVVLDDDPTGTQTCYDVTVLTSWSVELLVAELRRKPSVLFVLTNSRSLPGNEAVQLTFHVGKNLKEAVTRSGREILVISRSDSTLRGHFPAEVDAIAEVLEINDAVRVVIPAFIEGGRFTIDDVHYLVENEKLVPVSETPFAKDVVFGYHHANLKEWVEEKTAGKVPAVEVASVTLDDIRLGGPQRVAEKLKKCKPGSTCIVNAASYKDLEVFAMAVMLAEAGGRKFLYRSSATFVPIRAGMVSGRIFEPKRTDTAAGSGSLVVVGSHVPKTTTQLNSLLAQKEFSTLEIDVAPIVRSLDQAALAEKMIRQTDQWLSTGKDVAIYTSRKLEVGADAQASLKINALVSAFLVRLVKGLSVRPKFIVAKGGITSSDIASKGLWSEKALILGQVIPGVPVWRLDERSKFPDLIYVVFPGNVGDDAALANVCEKLSSAK